MRFGLKRIICTSLFFMFICICSSVNAANFGTIETRTNQNNKMINEANSLNWVYRNSLQNFVMKEFKETNYKGLNSSQQAKIKEIANTILGDENEYTDIQKMEKFYDFMLDNFYYYSTPQTLTGLNFDNRWNNPYYLFIYEYDTTGKVRANVNGYAMTLLMLARSQNIPARIVGGYYNKDVRDNYEEWGSNLTTVKVNHVWVEAYVDGKWKMFDPCAESYKKYDDVNSEYIDEKPIDEENPEETETIEENRRFFAPTMEELSKTHIAFKTYATSNSIEYISNSGERKKIVSFLNNKSGNYTNGKRINSSYNTTDSVSWFTKGDTKSVTNGYGYTKAIYWPANKSLTGKLNLNYFIKLEVLEAKNNKITELQIKNSPKLRSVNLQNNNLTKVVLTGSNKMTFLKTENNPATYIEYNFASNKRKAIVKAGSGGTIAADYVRRKDGKNRHYLKAKANKGYHFVGWYKDKKKISKHAKYNFTKGRGFIYVAKFEKDPPPAYVKISISKQKLWFYKKGKKTYTSSIVTGQRYVHDTPKGTFKVRGKARNVYLVGEDYRSFVNFWMPIYGDIGMHDASWRWSFGGTVYKYNGSHGCVNLPYKTAKYIYNNASVGTTVKVTG